MSARYSSLSIGLHWLMALLLVAVYACIELREFFPKGSDPRNALKTWHFMLGLSVFVLVWVRLLARWVGPRPAITPALPAWQARLSGLVQGLIYLLMIGMPLGGWLILSAEGKPVPFFGLTLPPLVAANETLAHQIEELHETFGKVGYGLIALHTVAALYHHYGRRDDTLRRMLPGV